MLNLPHPLRAASPEPMQASLLPPAFPNAFTLTLGFRTREQRKHYTRFGVPRSGTQTSSFRSKIEGIDISIGMTSGKSASRAEQRSIYFLGRTAGVDNLQTHAILESREP